MSKRPGVTRLGGIAALTTGLVLGLSGLATPGALAGPDKEPDRTPNDHPSGKDRSEEPGGKTQGASQSDPDGETNGGADKPGGDGGFDADKDGNNGCGNDDDFEDDNNGNCGGLRVRGAAAAKSAVKNSVVKAQGSPRVLDSTTEVMGVQFVRAQGTTASVGTAGTETRVLGTTTVRGSGSSGVSAGTLATTGLPVTALAALGTLLISAGGLMVIQGRREDSLA